MSKRRKFTKYEDEIILKFYPIAGTKHTQNELKKHGFERSIISIRQRAFKMNVKSGLLHKKNSGCFKRGSVPKNKGKKMSKEQYEKSAQTMFKKGRKSHTELHDGAIRPRLQKNGVCYLYIRTEKGKWEILHRHLWKKEIGEIKPGYILRFKSGKEHIFHPKNQELIELARKYKGRKIKPELDFLNDLCLKEILPHLEVISKKENFLRNQNYEKLKVTYKTMTDKQVAGRMTYNNPEARKELLKHPELIEVARQQILLKRQIKITENDCKNN